MSNNTTGIPRPKLTRAAVEAIVGHRICNLHPYIEAFIHKSMARSMGLSCERLELLGDAAVNLAVAEILFNRFPGANEGFITRVRVKLVSGKQMSIFARQLDLQKWLVLSNNARYMKIESNDRILEDIFEAFCGAVFLDCGYEACKAFVTRVIEQHADLENLVVESNHKDLLSRYAQQNSLGAVTYELRKISGPAHRHVFSTTVLVNNVEVGSAAASNKKTSEMLAALASLEYYGADLSETISGNDGDLH